MKAIQEILENMTHDEPFPDVLDAIDRARRELILEHVPERVVGIKAMHEILEQFPGGNKPIKINTLKNYARYESFPGRLGKDGKEVVFNPRVVLAEWEWAGRPVPERQKNLFAESKQEA